MTFSHLYFYTFFYSSHLFSLNNRNIIMFSQKEFLLFLMCPLYVLCGSNLLLQLFSPQKSQKKHKVFTKETDFCFFLCVPYVSYVVQIPFSGFLPQKAQKTHKTFTKGTDFCFFLCAPYVYQLVDKCLMWFKNLFYP